MTGFALLDGIISISVTFLLLSAIGLYMGMITSLYTKSAIDLETIHCGIRFVEKTQLDRTMPQHLISDNYSISIKTRNILLRSTVSIKEICIQPERGYGTPISFCFFQPSLSNP